MIIQKQELMNFRQVFQGNSEATEALKIIEQCDGNLVDAVDILMSIEKDSYRLGDDQSWIDFENIAKDLRAVICNDVFKNLIVNGHYPAGLIYLMSNTPLTAMLSIPLIMYISQLGYERFCQS